MSRKDEQGTENQSHLPPTEYSKPLIHNFIDKYVCNIKANVSMNYCRKRRLQESPTSD